MSPSLQPGRLPMDSSTSSDNSSNSPDTVSSGRCSSVNPPHSQPRKPIPRKGHTKSRRGCYNCKRRRIKCNERHPDCGHCVKAGLRCEYPANIIQSATRQSVEVAPPSPMNVVNLRSTPGVFTMNDMRLFHHFLITAYPHLPVGGDRIWTTVIPSFAHNYEYLIHAILALAASHLDAVSSANVAQEAISHRILAMQALNEALSMPSKSDCENSARMGAALALTFQSSHLQDGIAEFLTMVRGCNLIAMDGSVANNESAFNAFREDGHLATMTARLTTTAWPSIPHSSLDQAAMSLQKLTALPMTPQSRTFHTILIHTIDAAYERPVQCYTTFVTLYNAPSRWTHAEFQAFIDPHNGVAQILLAHFIAVQAVLTPILVFERVGFRGVDAPTATLGWIEGIWGRVPRALRQYVSWPREVARYPFWRFVGEGQVEF